MEWAPLTFEALEAMIAQGLESMDDAVRVAWEAMRIEPQRWQCSPWGDGGGGFWAVAESDGNVVWYNDIEDGFNISRFTRRGIIDEYLCNQNTFEQFLLSLPEARVAENWRDNAADRTVPPELQNGGTIIRRQTTYWDLRSTHGAPWRFHFRSKAEIRFVDSRFLKMEVVDSHPILEQYVGPWSQLFFYGVPSDPETLMEVLANRVAAASSGWRSIDEYVNKMANLRKGYGLFMSAPKTFVDIATAALGEMGIRTSVLETSRPAASAFRAAIMDKNIVIARGFRFERRTSS
jgi:hypothetical protein